MQKRVLVFCNVSAAVWCNLKRAVYKWAGLLLSTVTLIISRNQQYFSPINIVIFFFLVFIFKRTSLWPYRVGSTILICWQRNNACLRLCFVAKCHHKHAHGLRKFPLPLIYVYIMLMHTLIETLCGYAFAILIFTCLEHKMFSSCVLVLTPLFYNLWLSQHFRLS